MAYHMLPATARRARAGRRGITLMEVLISMGVLTVGLLSIAALIPAGRIELLQAVKLDYASMVGRGAFRDLKIRGYLMPGTTTVSYWSDANATSVWNFGPFTALAQTTSVVPLPVAIDPLGCAAGYSNTFPYGAYATLGSIDRRFPHLPTAAVGNAVARRSGLPLRRRFDADALDARQGFSALSTHVPRRHSADHPSRSLPTHADRRQAGFGRKLLMDRYGRARSDARDERADDRCPWRCSTSAN